MEAKNTDKKMHTMESLARGLYDPRLHYHNFEHALCAVATGRDICRRCDKEGIPINENVVVAALLFHDAGYWDDHVAKGFQTKEAYAAYLAEQSLKEFGYDARFIANVKRAIISTQHDQTFASNEEKAVRAADLAGLAGTYKLFLQNNGKLKAESELLSGNSISLDAWKRTTQRIIAFYLSQDIRLTKAYVDERGESFFHKRAKENLERYLQET